MKPFCFDICNVDIIYIFPLSVQLLLIGNEKVKTLWCFVKPESLNLLYPDQLHKGKLWNETKLFTIKNKSLEAMFFIQMKNSTLGVTINERINVCLGWFVYYGKSLSLKSKHDATVVHRQDLCDAPDKMVQFLNYSWWFVVCGAGGIWEGRLISRGHNYFRCNSFQNIWPSAEWSQHRQYLNCYTQFNNPRRDMRGNKIWNQIEKSRFCDSFTYFCKSRVKYCNWESVSGLQMGIRRAH